MKTDKYSVLAILDFKGLEQLVVPEVQRDYVWLATDVNDLLKSISDGFEAEPQESPYLGFIYAYNDKDFPYKYFLIDGQQRMTTLFLLLLACHVKLKRKLPNYLVRGDKVKLDYKVRQATHDFLQSLVHHFQGNSNEPSLEIKDQRWYHISYDNDPTIKNIISNFQTILVWMERYDDQMLMSFLTFVEKKVELSYFDIENGRDGEDLYIYMNSRGRQLAGNETLKASFLNRLPNTDDKRFWGAEWELWQDFFWRRKKEDNDAERGFDAFLKMVQMIRCFSEGSSNLRDIGNQTARGALKAELKFLPSTIDEIKTYFDAYRWFVEADFVQEFFRKYNEENLLVPDASRTQKDLLKFLPILTLVAETSLRDEEVVLRFLRFFYNLARKEEVGQDIGNQLPIAISLVIEYCRAKSDSFDVTDLSEYQTKRTTLINDEEVLKLKLYKNPSRGCTREQLETLFWHTEDHFLLKGNIGYLLYPYWDSELRYFNDAKFTKTWNAFQLVLPSKEHQLRPLVSKALLYGRNTWAKVTPGYYNNYDVQDWEAIMTSDSRGALLGLLEEMHDKSSDHLRVLVEGRIKDYFVKQQLDSVTKLKAVTGFVHQVRVLVAIDYYSKNVIWHGTHHIAESGSSESGNSNYGDTPFFDHHLDIFDSGRYISGGSRGRLIADMRPILQNEETLSNIIDKILGRYKSPNIDG